MSINLPELFSTKIHDHGLCKEHQNEKNNHTTSKMNFLHDYSIRLFTYKTFTFDSITFIFI